jgi:hypothetical protein
VTPSNRRTVYALGTIAAILCAGTGFDAALDLEPAPPPPPPDPEPPDAVADIKRAAIRCGYRFEGSGDTLRCVPTGAQTANQAEAAKLLAAEKRKRKAAKRARHENGSK